METRVSYDPGGTAAIGADARRADLLVLLAAVPLLFWGLGVRGLWAAEGRWAQVTREMFLTGDFFHPTIGGQPYFDKPLLTYWLRALISVPAGGLSELVIRLPSAIAGIVAVWATMRVGSRLWPARTGRLAGGLLLTTFAFVVWARTGTADAENLAAIMLAVAWYWSRRDRPGFLAMLVFYLIGFVGALTKGLTAVAVPIVIVLPDMLVERRWRLLFTARHFAALGIAVAVYLAPFAYASLTQPASYQSSGLALVFQENIQRFFRPIDHRGPIYLYVYQLPVLLLPWTPLFVLAAVHAARSWKGLDRHTRWLVWAIVLVFLFFTLSGSRRSYYILPIVPLCALLAAVFVTSPADARAGELRRLGLDIQRVLFAGLIIFELAMPLLLVLARWRMGFEAGPSMWAAGPVIGIAALAAGVALYKAEGRWKQAAGTDRLTWPLVVTAAILLGGFFCWQQNALEVNRTERSFAQELRARSIRFPPQRIGMFPRVNANILFYLGRDQPVQILKNSEQFRGFVASGVGDAVIAQSRDVAKLAAEITNDLARWQDLRQKVPPWGSKSARQEQWVAWLREDGGTAGTGTSGEGIEHAK
jgi:4-amino-4-deoxy-L-arabinose transferase-like glycosyltransferase